MEIVKMGIVIFITVVGEMIIDLVTDVAMTILSLFGI